MDNNEINCLSVRRLVTSDITNIGSDVMSHIVDCPACKSFYEKQLKYNSIVKKAVEVDVPEGLADRIMVQHQLSLKQEQTKKKFNWSAMAASLVLVFAVTAVTTLQSPPAIAGVILEHVHDEMWMFDDKKRVTLESLNQLLKPHGIKADESIGNATHAGDCLIRGKRGVHVVFDGKNAPVTLIVFPEPLEGTEPVSISDDVFKGVLLHTKHGTLALVSKDQSSVDDFQLRLKSSLMTFI